MSRKPRDELAELAIGAAEEVYLGTAIGAAAGGLVAGVPMILPGAVTLGGAVGIRMLAGGAGNAVSQLANNWGKPCASFNYGSLIGSTLGGYPSGLRAAGIAQAGLPTTGMAGFAQRAIAGISGTGTAAISGIIGTSLGDTSASGSSCCAPNTCCASQQ